MKIKKGMRKGLAGDDDALFKRRTATQYLSIRYHVWTNISI